ncbi:transposase IS3/IS911 family protein, partial [mine drainage metagenome]
PFLYNLEGGARESTLTQYAAERKESVVRRMLKSPDRSIREWSQETGLSPRSLYDWRRKAIQGDRTVAEQAKPSGQHSSGTKRSAAQKLAVVVATTPLNEAELAGYGRAHGLYPEEVHAWRTAA